MAYTLTICRLGQEWVVRDVTGTFYGHTLNFNEIENTANRMAKLYGGHVALSEEAKAHLAAALEIVRRPKSDQRGF